MITTRDFRHAASVALSLCERRLFWALMVCVGIFMAGNIGPRPARAQTYPGDPVEELSKALQVRVSDPAKDPEGLTIRRILLTQRTQALKTLNEIQRGLALDGWLDWETDQEDDPLHPEASIDRAIRSKLADRYYAVVRGALESGTTSNQAAAAKLITDLGTTILGVGGNTSKGLNRELAPDLAKLIKAGSPELRDAAVRALTAINPEARVAVPALAELLQSSDPVVRRTGAAGLSALMQKITELVSGKKNRPRRVVECSEYEVVDLARLLLPKVAMGLVDADAEVRRESTEAVYHASIALEELVPIGGRSPTVTGFSAEDLEDKRSAFERRNREVLVPFGRVLANEAAGLKRVLTDSEPRTRLMSRKAMEEVGNAFRRHERFRAIFPGNAETAATLANDQLVKVLHLVMPQLTTGVSDPNLEVRRATIDVLEVYGEASKPAAPALVQALADSDPFIRWGAARTLGKIGSVEENTAVPALAKLLEEPDLDLRIAAAWALERYGPAARAAVPALAKAVGTGDPEIRRAVMTTLVAIGKDAESAIPAITAELANRNPGVRVAAADSLSRFGSAARTAESALKKALGDDDPEVRKAAAAAVLNITASREK